MGNETLMWLFMVFFMFHEFEEMIYLTMFLKTNRDGLKAKTPKRFHKRIDEMAGQSNNQLIFAVFEEFVLLCAIIVVCIALNLYSLFVAVVIAYILHVIAHLVQAIYVRMYIPAVGSGLISTVYCVLCVVLFNRQGVFSWAHVAVFIPAIALLIVGNLKFAHYLSKKVVK